jgi:hypothetical protein
LITSDLRARTLRNGRRLRQTMQEGRSPKLHVLTAGSAMTIETPARTYICTLVDTGSACHGDRPDASSRRLRMSRSQPARTA